MAEESLKIKTIKGTLWSAADAFLGQGVTFIVGLILARLLSPNEYGLIGICFIFNAVLNGIVDSGFSNALIRKKDTTDEDYSTMFITNLVISFVLYALLFATSPLIAHFFSRPELMLLIRVTGVILFINALSIIQVTILIKRIDFKTKTKASLISAILSGIIGITMAYNNFGVWALVGQTLSKQVFYTICLWILNKWWPNFKFSKESFHYMWGFGWKLLVSGLLNNIWNQLYQVVVGKYYSPATLGQYTRSQEYAGIFSSNITSIIQRVTFPVLSEVQNNQQRMVDGYRRIIKITMFVTAICMISLAAVAEPLISCLIGAKWAESATYLPLICISMSLYPLHAINLNMLQVQGRSDIFLYLEIIKKFLALVPISIGIYVNIYWMLIASIIIGIISFFLNTWYTGKILGYTSWMQLKDVSADYGVAIIIALSVFFLKYLPFSNWVVLPIQIIVGFFVCLFVCESIKLTEYIEVKQIVISMIQQLKSGIWTKR